MGTATLATTFGAFFAIMNPFVNLPLFLALTSGFTVAEQRALALRVTLISAAMCGVILIGGRQIIDFFGITVDQFRIAGGIVLAHIAWSMLNGQSIASHHGAKHEQQDMKELTSLAFYPMAFPMIVGPGTIATLIIYAGHASGLSDLAQTGAVVATVLVLLFVVLFFASFFGRVLTETMRVIMTRLMGMILLSIAVAMILTGITNIFPAAG